MISFYRELTLNSKVSGQNPENKCGICLHTKIARLVAFRPEETLERGKSNLQKKVPKHRRPSNRFAAAAPANLRVRMAESNTATTALVMTR